MRMFLVVPAAVFLAGCSTTTGPTAVNQLQIRMAKVENRLDRRDEDIRELQYAVEEITVSVGELAGAVTIPRRGSEALSSVSTVEKGTEFQKDGILRVPVTPREAQTALKKAGYYDGAIDGKLGAGSQRAIRAFQKDQGLESDGIIGKKTWARLKGYLK